MWRAGEPTGSHSKCSHLSRTAIAPPKGLEICVFIVVVKVLMEKEVQWSQTQLSPCVDPKALCSGKEVVSTPEFFDEWLHDYRNLSEVAPCSPLDISSADLADSQYDLQIVCMLNYNAPLPMHHILR